MVDCWVGSIVLDELLCKKRNEISLEVCLNCPCVVEGAVLGCWLWEGGALREAIWEGERGFACLDGWNECSGLSFGDLLQVDEQVDFKVEALFLGMTRLLST